MHADLLSGKLLIESSYQTRAAISFICAASQLFEEGHCALGTRAPPSPPALISTRKDAVKVLDARYKRAQCLL